MISSDDASSNVQHVAGLVPQVSTPRVISLIGAGNPRGVNSLQSGDLSFAQGPRIGVDNGQSFVIPLGISFGGYDNPGCQFSLDF